MTAMGRGNFTTYAAVIARLSRSKNGVAQPVIGLQGRKTSRSGTTRLRGSITERPCHLKFRRRKCAEALSFNLTPIKPAYG
jgi:hypothetical protein